MGNEGVRESTYLCAGPHGIDPRRALLAHAPDDLSTAELELARLCALVGDTGAAMHLGECELFDELCPCVRGELVFLHEGLAVGFVVEYLRI